MLPVEVACIQQRCVAAEVALVDLRLGQQLHSGLAGGRWGSMMGQDLLCIGKLDKSQENPKGPTALGDPSPRCPAQAPLQPSRTMSDEQLREEELAWRARQ